MITRIPQEIFSLSEIAGLLEKEAVVIRRDGKERPLSRSYGVRYDLDGYYSAVGEDGGYVGACFNTAKQEAEDEADIVAYLITESVTITDLPSGAWFKFKDTTPGDPEPPFRLLGGKAIQDSTGQEVPLPKGADTEVFELDVEVNVRGVK